MPTNTPAKFGPDIPQTAQAFFRRQILFNTPGITAATTYRLSSLPAGAQVFECLVKVTTVFNDSGTAQLKVGDLVTAVDDLFKVTDGDLKVAAPAAYVSNRGMDVVYAADTDIYAQYVGQNANATTGAGFVVVTFCANISVLN